jgi:MFS family permease
MAARAPVLTARFVLVVTAGLGYFLSLGMVLPAVPQYVEHRLDGDSVAVGVAVGILFVGAVLVRPFVGRLGDRVGRRSLMIAGAAIVAVSVALYGVVASLPFLIAIRALTGIGEAAFFVGAATMITDLAPVERRGEAISYWSVAVYGGLAFGPALGEAVLEAGGFETVWAAAAGMAALATVLSFFTRDIERPPAPDDQGPLLNRGAMAPGIVLFFGLIALAAFVAFVPLYVDDVGLGSADTIFILYGGLVLLVRIFGARLPDILGARRAGALALTGTTVGMVIMALWGTSVGLFVGTIFFAIGASFLYPAILLLALERGGDEERGAVVGTVSSFFDLSQGVGALIVGGVAAATSYQGAFAAGAVFAIVGWSLLRFGSASRTTRTASVADEGAFAVEHPGP